VRKQALSGLSTVATPQAIDAVIAATGSGSVADRETALALAATLPGPRAAEAVTTAVGDRDPRIATAAIEALGEMPEGGRDPRLAGFVGDPGAPLTVRTAAARVLRERGGEVSPEVAAAIERLLGPDEPRVIILSSH
jgi:HEAT repeat protein